MVFKEEFNFFLGSNGSRVGIKTYYFEVVLGYRLRVNVSVDIFV